MSRIGRTPHHLARLAVTATLALGLSACGGDAGSLPDFPYQDYSYTLGHECFCAAIDQRYRITVTDGEVSSITFATPGKGHQVGDPVDADYLRLTIQDIIDRGNDSKMAKVIVEWPAGQLYPDSVYLDPKANVVDEEVTWLISDVDPA